MPVARTQGRCKTCLIVGSNRTRPVATNRTVCSRCASVLISGNRNLRLRSRRVSTSSSKEPRTTTHPRACRQNAPIRSPAGSVRVPASPCLGLPPAHSNTTSAPLPSVSSLIAATGSSLRASSARSARAPARSEQASSRTSDGHDQPGPARSRDLKHSRPMLPCPKIATESPMLMPAVSTAATLSLKDCKQAASLSEMRSSTLTSAISGRIARSASSPEAENR